MPRADALDTITEHDLRGFRHLKKVLPLFGRLRDCNTARDRAHNRTLHYDQYCALLLLRMFNPSLATVRALQQASELGGVRRKLGCSRASLGSLSEAARVFDPDLLVPLIAELGAELRPLAKDPRLGDVKAVVTLVDGTLLRALPRVAAAMWLSTRTGTRHAAWRLHAQFELDKYVPTRADLTDGRNSGKGDEENVLRKALAPGRLYVMDRWYAQFTLFNDVRGAGSSYVCRLRDNSAFGVVEERPLTDEARRANVVRDVVIEAGLGCRASARPDHPVRLVVVKAEPHEKRSNRKGNTGAGPGDGLLRIATDLLDVPADVVALLYRYRYAIELFFRWLKHVLGCHHLLSHSPDGVRIQCYVAVIACTLLALYTARRPTPRTFEMFGHFLTGLATEAELLEHLDKPDNRGVKLRAKDELWKKLGY